MVNIIRTPRDLKLAKLLPGDRLIDRFFLGDSLPVEFIGEAVLTCQSEYLLGIVVANAQGTKCFHHYGVVFFEVLERCATATD